MNSRAGLLGRQARESDAGPSENTKRIVQDLYDAQARSILIGRSPAFQEAVANLPPVARSEGAVLVQGETGTGKELVARAIHYLSQRAACAFIPVNCASLPETLLEDELFGHERGAFTGAHAERPGIFAEAHKGTLFLDEVDLLTQRAQAALLRVLQDKRYRPVGANCDRQADVRIVAATNAPLDQRLTQGQFRPDLFYRLCMFSIRLPPLRHRKEDVLVLAEHFLSKHAPGRALQFSPSSRASMLAWDWPGNVRELENLVVRGSHLCRGEVIRPEDLGLPPVSERSDQAQSASSPASLIEPMRDAKRQFVDTFEKDYLTRLLASNAGNVTRAARVAQKDRRELGKLLKKHGIDPKHFAPQHDLTVVHCPPGVAAVPPRSAERETLRS